MSTAQTGGRWFRWFGALRRVWSAIPFWPRKQKAKPEPLPIEWDVVPPLENVETVGESSAESELTVVITEAGSMRVETHLRRVAPSRSWERTLELLETRSD